MRRAITRQAGFTIIEVMVVVAMMAVISMMAAPLLSDTLQRKDIGIFSADAVDALRDAQSATMSGRNNARYGVHFEGISFTFFQGASYVQGDANNVVHALSANVTITAVTLSPGSACTLPAGTGNCDVHFSDRRGIPAQSGTVTFAQAGGTDTKTVTINAAGMIDHD